MICGATDVAFGDIGSTTIIGSATHTFIRWRISLIKRIFLVALEGMFVLLSDCVAKFLGLLSCGEHCAHK